MNLVIGIVLGFVGGVVMHHQYRERKNKATNDFEIKE